MQSKKGHKRVMTSRDRCSEWESERYIWTEWTDLLTDIFGQSYDSFVSQVFFSVYLCLDYLNELIIVM